jgi:two-component system chemotaxis sensor kinase CheA
VGDTVDTSSLLGDYLDDARNHIDSFDSALLDIERETEAGLNHELVTALLGSLHTLKGNSGMMGFATIQQFIHELEGVFKRLLDAPDLLNEQVLNSLFESATILRNAVEQVATNPQPDLSQETAYLERLCTADRVRAAGRKKKGAARKAGASTDSLAEASAASDIAVAEPVSAPGAPTSIQSKSNILRVAFERLDHLLNLAGELVIHRTKLNQLAKQAEDLVEGSEISAELPRVAQSIDKTTAELQEAIMRVRMLPVRQVFQRFPRMVRDLAKQKGKEVELGFTGEDTEIDKTVIDALGEPLLHLIRNSIDHGIESPQVREAHGKDRAGNIRLTAKQESSHIMITVMDDGGGMHVDRIRQKALQKGLITSDQQLSDEDVFGLVFEPGFSTAETVTETSGRGMGLDVVKKVISDFNGIIEVKSTPGLGTEFILKMPLTLAIIPALLVETSGELFAVPLTAVLESVKVNAEDVHVVDGREVIQIRGNVLPVKRLNRVFSLPATQHQHYYLVILGRAEKRLGVLVDRLRGQQEVVIKALDDYLGDTAGISGATVLGDGRVVLIVDTARLL